MRSFAIQNTEKEKANMTEELKSTLGEVTSQMRSYIRNALDLPSNVTVSVNFVDKANRTI